MSVAAPPHRTLLNRLSPADVAIDFGTANTLIYTADRGLVLNQPSVVCFARGAQQDANLLLAAIGRDAHNLLGRAPAHLEAVRPLQHGVIANAAAAGQMMRRFVHMAHAGRRFGRRAEFTVCVPSRATPVERRAILEAARGAGAGHVTLLDGPLASALGAGLPVESATGSMIVDIGCGTTEAGVLAFGGIAHNRSAHLGGERFDVAIAKHVRSRYGVLLGQHTVEHLKRRLGSALRDGPIEHLPATGRSLANGLPRTIELSTDDVADAIAVPLHQLIEFVKSVIDGTPPELVTDIARTGIVLAGGGALLANLDRRLAVELRVDVRVADEPLTCAVRGAAARFGARFSARLGARAAAA